MIGAGIGGLSAAYDLVNAGNKVVVFEASGSVGGLASGFKESHWDWSIERYYHHWFASDHHMLGLIKELGWSDKVLFPKPKTVMNYRVIVPLTDNPPFFIQVWAEALTRSALAWLDCFCVSQKIGRLWKNLRQINGCVSGQAILYMNLCGSP